ncbi:spinster family MFS transporter [Sphingomonas colocasiae]|uniref:MFS transporter n=1 Tax=Sphingomonas colocasiae TaxID=1848973 RepID=A0ABS7PNR2_9SPHN|nr:MFS transporter [Sphingomonas colocasiae]MBY8822634.1 MFS transporter [Sphingomonas colocasiae]
MTDAPRPPAPSETPAAGRPLPYGALALLMTVYAFNLLDRQIVTILVEPMKADLGLADWQIGMISGLAFALFYTLLGIPLARLADRGNRVGLIAVSLLVWSGFTALCGVARNFTELLLARIGVGIGEAGCTPAAHSLITDYVPRERRGWALSLYSLGVPVGSLAGLVLGGVLLASLGWRAAFLVAGLPGMLLAGLVWFALDEPRRRAAGASSAASPQLPLGEVIATLRRLPSFWLISFGTAMGAFGYYGQAAFFGSLYMRTHSAGLDALAVSWGVAPSVMLGLALGLMVGVIGMLGTLAGGHLADRAARGGIAGYTRVPSITLVLAAPLFAGAAMAGTIDLSFVLLGLAIFVHALNYGSVFAAVQTLAKPSIRAMASAIQLFITNAIGLALGPLFVGVASDLLAPSLGSEQGLRAAMALVALPLALGSLLFWLGGRRIAADEQADQSNRR